MKKIAFVFCCLLSVACTDLKQADTVWINNQQNEKLYVRVDGAENAPYHRLAIVQHGLASNMQHPAVLAAKKAFLDNHYVVISFDGRYSLGESDNRVELVRLKTFDEDLQTVTKWAKSQPFYSEPFALSGHSLGGASILRFGAQHPEMVNFLVPITPVVSGKLWEKSCMENLTDFCKHWQQSGSYEYIDPQNHKTAVIPYAVVVSSFDYDANLIAPKISAETLLIGAKNDIIIATDSVSNLSSKIKHANVATVAGSGHNFENKANQSDLYRVIYDFLNIE